jgi:hypothetical protein
MASSRIDQACALAGLGGSLPNVMARGLFTHLLSRSAEVAGACAMVFPAVVTGG